MSDFFIFTDKVHYYNINTENFPFFSQVHPGERLDFFTSKAAADNALSVCVGKLRNCPEEDTKEHLHKLQSLLPNLIEQTLFEKECSKNLYFPFLRG